MRRWRGPELGIVVGVAISILLSSWLIEPGRPYPSITFRTSCGVASGPWLSSRNATADLPVSFANGSVQAFGSNESSVMFGGIAFYDRNHQPYDSLPALGSYSPASSTGRDLTGQARPFFDRGGVFPVGWNGSGWLIAGQTTVGESTEGSAIFLQGGHITNLTPSLGRYFQGQGIWIAGWDGKGWLLGGNDSRGAVLVYLNGNSVMNLTDRLPNNHPGDWVQMVGWNGTGWLVGGQGIFGSYSNGRFTDLLPQSPFASGAVFAMDWNGTDWLAGGSPLQLAYVQGDRVIAAPAPTNRSVGWVNSIVALPSGGWLVSGGSYLTTRYSPFLSALTTVPTHPVVRDESACLPAAFDGGWVQFGGWAPAYGARTVLLVGEGGADPMSFSSHSAAVAITVGD
ncbi:MAG: hypothetical protein L3J99_06235 [Thermoplasmata archaeon]|nr:hypothetical protein [Thermoplasmata archaeon]